MAYMRLLEASNMLTALTLMKRIKATYRSRVKIVTDGALERSTTGRPASS
jgi:hypothetical protein